MSPCNYSGTTELSGSIYFMTELTAPPSHTSLLCDQSKSLGCLQASVRFTEATHKHAKNKLFQHSIPHQKKQLNIFLPAVFLLRSVPTQMAKLVLKPCIASSTEVNGNPDTNFTNMKIESISSKKANRKKIKISFFLLQRIISKGLGWLPNGETRSTSHCSKLFH